MKILFAGTTKHAAEVLKFLVSSNHEIISVLTRKDAPIGRKAVITPSAVALMASDFGIPVIKTNKLTNDDNELISKLAPDLGVVIAYGALLPNSTLLIPKHGWLNLHYSLLPQWRGAAPVQHSIMSGNTTTGVSIFRLDEGMDTGPILSQVRTDIQPGETSGDLLQRLTHIGISALEECLPLIESNLAVFKPQVGDSTVAKKLERSDAKIDFHSNAESIELLIRAMNPEPIAWTLFDGQPFRVLAARATSGLQIDIAQHKVGAIFAAKNRIFTICGQNSALELIRVQPSGKKEMTAADWFRGLSGSAAFNG